MDVSQAPAPWWFQGLTGMAGGLLAGGGVTAWVQTRHARRAQRTESLVADIRAAQDCLRALCLAIRKLMRNARGVEPEQIDDLVTELLVAADRTGSDRIVALTRAYVDLAERLASGDEDVGHEREQAVYDPLAAALRTALNRRR